MSDYNCPNCNINMKDVDEPDILYERCPKCEGIFLDKDELNTLVTGMSGDIELASIDMDNHKDIFGTRKCPKCDNVDMRKINLLRFSNILYDYCPECEGFFLDKNELDTTNVEVAKLTENEITDEFRKNIDNFLVRGDVIPSLTLGGNMFRQTTGMLKAEPVLYYRICVYYPQPLDFDVNLFKEKLTFKFGKLFGINKQQDIKTGHDEFDSFFVIQSDNKEKALNMFNNELIEEIIKFKKNPIAVIDKSDSIELNSEGIFYLEGPYSKTEKLNFEEESKQIVKYMVSIASKITNE